MRQHRLDHRVDGQHLDAGRADGSLSGRWNSSVSITPGFTHVDLHVVPVSRRSTCMTRPTPRSRPWSRRTRPRPAARAAPRPTTCSRCGPPARSSSGEQREREPHRREVVDAHRRLDDLGRRASITRLRFGMPALFTSTSMPPSSSADLRPRTLRARRGRRGRPSTPAIRARARGTRASTSSSRSARRAQMPTVAPRFGEPLGERGADARRRAGHQHVLAAE